MKAQACRCWMAAAAGAVLAAGPAAGFDGHRAEGRLLGVEIGEVEGPRALDDPVEVPVSVWSRADAPMSVRLDLQGLADDWYPVDPPRQVLAVGPGQHTGHVFRIAVSNQVYRALYPVRVTAAAAGPDGADHTLEAIRVFASALEAGAPAPPHPPSS